MEFFVLVKAFDSVVGEEAARVQRMYGQQMQRMMASGKLKASGALVGMRGAFFVLDADAPEDILMFLGNTMLQNFDVKVYPTMPVAKLGEIFAQQA
ncbi:MAG: hypothetical protein ACXVI8_07740 [Halobacteriota archaeon]